MSKYCMFVRLCIFRLWPQHALLIAKDSLRTKFFHPWRDGFQNAEALVRNALDEKFQRAVPEITVYLVEGVGNSTRIDYGTGQW